MNAKMNINNIRNHYNTIGQLEHDASSRETSVEIMYAIAERASDYAELQSIWDNGTHLDDIVARAWELASDNTDTLYWGCQSFDRNNA